MARRVLPGGLGPDLNAAAEHVRLVLQGQGPLPTAKEVREGLGKGRLNPGKLPTENGLHLLGDLLDHSLQFPLGGLHVVFLVLEVAIPLLHPLKFLHRPQVYSAQGLYGLVQLNPCAAGRAASSTGTRTASAPWWVMP